jgi:osmotically inducible protein OsmC
MEGREQMKRKASAQWQGDLKTGKGAISTESGVLESTPYSFTTRFESGKGTNPEELVAAAHAGCFTMALSAELGKANLVAESLRTTATVTLDRLDLGWSITESHLEVVAKIPGASPEVFRKAAETAETGCPISRLFNTKITMDAKLEP